MDTNYLSDYQVSKYVIPFSENQSPPIDKDLLKNVIMSIPVLAVYSFKYTEFLF